ncbi:DUF2147 domain-containing protein [Sphingomonas sp. CFBP 13720]|uniref:DUF2147 domain-containing protein n=1 Tax=Sphingomonas sp. CFBP 13720 TaxID=2775302 RepID=UPI00177DD30D|nr:DUF2147 domain-containing protein [Sphingomonas sp. CFBP 13720]MBD8677635.1 DUF2147 domain-containing protein [Sphingomonas sp. CFBP 13720]
MKIVAAFALTLLAASPAWSAEPITGRWITQDRAAVIEIARCGPALCGRIARVLIAKPGTPTTDISNPDASLRQRPIAGLPILTAFTDQGSDWRGRIYDPRRGKTYKSIVSRQPDGTLKVQGCIAVFCQTQVWRRAG